MSDNSITGFCQLQENRKVYVQGKHNIEMQTVKHKLPKIPHIY